MMVYVLLHVQVLGAGVLGRMSGFLQMFITLIFVELLSEPGQQVPGSPVPTLPEHDY